MDCVEELVKHITDGRSLRFRRFFGLSKNGWSVTLGFAEYASCQASWTARLGMCAIRCFQFGVIELLARRRIMVLVLNQWGASRRAFGGALVHIEAPWHLPDLAQ